MPLQEFYRMCHNAGADEATATKWLRELQRRNLVVHFDQSKTLQLENAVILRPYVRRFGSNLPLIWAGFQLICECVVPRVWKVY